MKLTRWCYWLLLAFCLACGLALMRAQEPAQPLFQTLEAKCPMQCGGVNYESKSHEDKYDVSPLTGPPRTVYLPRAMFKPSLDEPQESAKNICGTNIADYTPNITLLQIACVDYEALRKVSPELPWPDGSRTQVLIHVRTGDVARITVDGMVKFSDVITDAEGRRIAMVQFDGMEHMAADVNIYAEVKP